jgi:hypothetical protein
MNTALIIICIVFAAGIVLWAVTHFGTAIRLDKGARDRGIRDREAGRTRGREPRDLRG